MRTTIPKVLLLLMFIFLFAGNIKAQERDSLLNLLEKHKLEDTTRVNLLNETSYYYWFERRSRIPLVKEALVLSEKLKYTKGILESKFLYVIYLIQINKPDSAKILMDEMYDLSVYENYKYGICLSHLSFLYYYYGLGDYDLVLEYYEKISSECIELHDKFIFINSNQEAGKTYVMMGDTVKAKECMKKAEPYFDELENNGQKSWLLYYRSTYFKNIFKYSKRYNETYDKLLQLVKKMDDKQAEAYIIYRLDARENLGKNHSKALESAYHVLELYQELDDTLKTANTSAFIAYLFILLNDVEKSKYYSFYSLRLHKLLNNKRGITNSLIDLGFAYIEQDSLEKAHDYFSEGLNLSIEINHNHFRVWSYIGLSLLADKQNELDKADEYYKKILQYKSATGTVEIAHAYAQLANHYILKQDYKNAKHYADSSYLLSQEINNISVIIESSEVLYKIYSYKEKYDLAYKYLLLNHQLSDSIKANEAKELAMVYDFEQTNNLKRIEQEKKDIIKEKELKQQKTLRNFFIAGFAIVFLLSIVIFRNYRQKNKANKLLKEQRNEIQEINEELNSRNEEILTQRDTVVKQKEEIEIQSKELTDSIQYAKRIQTAILPPETYINELLHEYFIFYKPRDIVSGDFYWVKQINQYIIIAAADCTGHGVPGAFMSMLGISFLNEIVQRREITQANQILNELRRQIKHSLRQRGQTEDSKDGMDIALITLDTKTNILQYSGAFNPLYLFKDKDGSVEFIEIQADRMPVGIHLGKEKSFTNQEIKLEIGDTLYIFSDGYQDQLGGPKGKKFMRKNFQNLLSDIQDKSMTDQRNILENNITSWMQDYEQIDDILVMGIRIN